MSKVLTSLGLMSGTSMDGIDAAIIRTDGKKIFTLGPFFTTPYVPELKLLLKEAVENKKNIDVAEEAITLAHSEVISIFLDREGLNPQDIDVIGFHGHTIEHNPAGGKSWQIGNGKLLARQTGIDVVYDFRGNDIKEGGQGAPLVPVFHKAIMEENNKPMVVLNIGGVANVTYMDNNNLLAMDTGPGNALIDDFVSMRSDLSYDRDGQYGLAGTVNSDVVGALMRHGFFSRKPPKSLDRYDFSCDMLEDMSPENGAATLAAFTAEAVRRSFGFFPDKPEICYVSGGGRHNPAIMQALDAKLPCCVSNIDNAGFDGDALEAQAFAFLAVRSIYKLPLTFSSTTGVRKSSATGGVFCPA